MKRLLFVLLVLALAGLPALTQDQGEGEESGESVSDADVVAVLEEINEKLDRIAPGARRKDGKVEFGGGPYFRTRYLFDMDTMNDYLGNLGSYDDFSPVIAPFSNGGGGTWRWTVGDNWQFGMDYWGFGHSELGFRNHQGPDSGNTANNANDTIDENGDGLDDYYSYANYGLGMFSGLAAYKKPLGKQFFATGTVNLGIGSESFSISESERSVIKSAFRIDSSEFAWHRSLFMIGARLGGQWKPGGADSVFGMAVVGGFDYFVPMNDWQPEAGVHRTDEAPSDDFNPMNAYLIVGPTFNY
jgi:hypothetical protein